MLRKKWPATVPALPHSNTPQVLQPAGNVDAFATGPAAFGQDGGLFVPADGVHAPLGVNAGIQREDKRPGFAGWSILVPRCEHWDTVVEKAPTSKPQAPQQHQTSNPKQGARKSRHLVLGLSLEPGCWRLELSGSKSYHRNCRESTTHFSKR